MRIAITGASGNVGSALLRRLLQDDHELVGIARRPAHEEFPAVRWVSADLTKDSCATALWEAFDGADAVVHLAWGFQPSHDLRYLEELGVGGTRRVLEAVNETGVPHLVHMSSVGAYSHKRDDQPVDEGYPTEGIPTSPYSRHKAAAERLLDAHEATGRGALVSRIRPGIVGRRRAGSALLRYGLPGILPAKVVDLVPVLPLDKRLRIPMVAATDVTDAMERVIRTRVGGAFNLAADPPITAERVAEVLGARLVHVPAPALRAVLAGAWRARVEQVDPGWLDLAYSVPLLDTSRASRALGWSPQVDAVTALRETLAGMREESADRTPILRPRSVPRQLRDALRHGPVSSRRRP